MTVMWEKQESYAVVYFAGKCWDVLLHRSLYAGGTCVEGAIHLVGGDGISRGRVLYCYQGIWYSLCSDNWDTTGEEARVLCHSLGYDTSHYSKT